METKRDEKGRFVKGECSSPKTQFKKGFTPWNKGVTGYSTSWKGRKMSPESRKKLSKAHLGKPLSEQNKANISKALKGREMSEEWINKIRVSNTKHGNTNINKLIRSSAKFIKWRKEVFKRDNYTCQECKKRGGIYLHAHHVKQFAFYPELRFDTNNGITLCRDCHKNIKHVYVQKELITL